MHRSSDRRSKAGGTKLLLDYRIMEIRLQKCSIELISFVLPQHFLGEFHGREQVDLDAWPIYGVPSTMADGPHSRQSNAQGFIRVRASADIYYTFFYFSRRVTVHHEGYRMKIVAVVVVALVLLCGSAAAFEVCSCSGPGGTVDCGERQGGYPMYQRTPPVLSGCFAILTVCYPSFPFSARLVILSFSY